MTDPILFLKLWMIVTALAVAPFHRFAAVYVGCYAAAVLFRDFGASEVAVNLGWHGAAFAIATCFPVMRSSLCKLAFWMFGPLLCIDMARVLGLVDPYYGWWAVYWIVLAQTILLHFGVDSTSRRRAIQGFMDNHGGKFFRVRAA